ncbi:uncharacterized protein RAG0_09416 [Rhynchosporium agropyri]|uniref:ferric-chelate reductase (NADPH) n=1 Tax=Rhynchosporium agropyri TaxID=914238 RepID=A0A1E1KVB8_9HELO|nr:uncharacterized protein RAG0_09416 [Rhynchosporium agropyri]
MALSLTPAIVALSRKFNLITLVTGMSYERLTVYHHLLGYVCLGLGMVHLVAFGVAVWRDASYWPFFEHLGMDECTGFVVLILLMFITVFSIPFFRQYFYQAFVSSHIILYIVYLIFLFLHTAHRHDTWAYLYATLDITLTSNISRLILKAKPPCSALIQDLDGEMLRLTIPAFNGLTWKTGQHVHLRFCGLKWWESHPFTITSLCDETFVTDKNGISTRSPLLFFIKPRKGLTRHLMNIAQQRETLKVLIDGPYGANDLDLFEGD